MTGQPLTGQPFTVFICYRRADASDAARSLALSLEPLLAEDALFMDVDSLTVGKHWQHEIRDTIKSCDVLIAVIGRQWLTVAGEDGRRRLDDPEDPVRSEIETAIDHGVGVYPVLFNGAVVPSEDALPGKLEELVDLQALEIRHEHFKRDVEALVEALTAEAASRGKALRADGSGAVQARPKPPPEAPATLRPIGQWTRDERDRWLPPVQPDPTRWPVILTGAALLILLVVAAAFLRPDPGPNGNGPEPTEEDGQEEHEVIVNATSPWTDSGIDLEVGDVVGIAASGELLDDVTNPDRRFTPDGEPDTLGEHPGDCFQDINHAALIGRVDVPPVACQLDTAVFFVGTQFEFTASDAGRLFLGINDGRFDDNDGFYEASIGVKRARPDG